MTNVKRVDLTRDVMAKYGLDKEAAERFVQQMFAVLREGIEREKNVKVKSLGTFKITSVNARESVDVNTGERIVIDGRNKITFTPDVVLRDRVNSPFAQFETVVLNEGVDFSQTEPEAEASDTIDEIDNSSDVEEGVTTDEVENNATEEIVPKKDNEATAAHVAASASSTLAPAMEEPASVIEKSATVSEKPVSTSTEAVSSSEESVPTSEESVPTSEASVPTSEEAPSHSKETTAGDMASLNISSLHIANVHIDAMHSGEKSEDTNAEASAQTQSVASSKETEKPNTQAVADRIERLKDENFALKNENRKLKNSCRRYVVLYKRAMWIMGVVSAVAIVLVAAGIWGIYYHLSIEQQNKTQLVTLQKDYNLLSNRFQTLVNDKDAQTEDVSFMTASATNASSSAKEKTASATLDEKGAAANQTANAITTSPVTNATPSAVKPLREEVKMPEVKKPGVKAPEAKTPASSAYDADPRVRTGAYQIIGIDKTVTLRQGQTLKSISRAYLGEGMECYVEAVNKGPLSVGDKVNIPKLKLKKKH